MRNLLFLAGLLILSLSCTRAPSTSASQTTPELPSIGNRLSDVARDVLEDPETFAILSIDPQSGWKEHPDDAVLFRNYIELGRTDVADEATRRRVVALLYEGINENDEMVAACFNPRHGIHATKGPNTVDLVICYECMQIYVFVNDEERGSCLTGESVEPALSRIWRDQGLQIAK